LEGSAHSKTELDRISLEGVSLDVLTYNLIKLKFGDSSYSEVQILMFAEHPCSRLRASISDWSKIKRFSYKKFRKSQIGKSIVKTATPKDCW